MAQHDYNIADQNGLDFLADLNSALSAVATNNAGATEPNPPFASMLWFDTDNNLLKVRNENNSAWIIMARKDGNGWTPYRQGVALGTASVQGDDRYAHRANNLSDLGNTQAARNNLDASPSPLDEDDFASNSATRPPSQQSTKSYVDKGSCKAWVNFDGTGTLSIRDSLNVSSVTDNGTGIYTVNFTNALADSNYAALTSVKGRSANPADYAVVVLKTVLAGSLEIRCHIGNQNYSQRQDKDTICVSIFQ